MSEFFYWFGVLHVLAYAFAGFMVATAIFIEWSLEKLKIKRDVIIAFREYIKRKRAHQPEGE